MATTTTRSRLLQLAIPLARVHGFTRETLARSVLALPDPPAAPLSDTAVTALFGQDDDARRVLVTAWLDDATRRMSTEPSPSSSPLTMRHVLRARIRMNVPVLAHLPEAFAVLVAGNVVGPAPLVEHAARVADQACWTVHPTAKELSWYARRASVSAVYLAAELHQLASPSTAERFLDDLLDNADGAEKTLDEVAVYGEYVLKSCKGILKSIL